MDACGSCCGQRARGDDRSGPDGARIRRLRKRLLARREELHRQRASAAELWRRVGDGGPADLADRASQDGERAGAGQLAEATGDAIAEIDRALEKLEEGSYGACDECGAPISPRRLRAIPWAARCVACQARKERARHDAERPRPGVARWAVPFGAWDEEAGRDASFIGFRATRMT